MVLTPTFYTLEGEAIVGPDITLKPTEIRFVDTKSLIPEKERDAHKWGGIALSYFGGFLEEWAQLTLHGIRGGGSLNVLFTTLTQKRSNTAEAVWWTPAGGSAVIALGNSSDQPVQAKLAFANGQSQSVEVRPFATELVRLDSDVDNLDRAGAVSLSYTGPEGGLIPTGYTSSADGRFTSMIRFYDTQQIVQPNLYATDLRIRGAKPRMVLRNISNNSIEATPVFLPLDEGTDQSIKLPVISLAPSQTVNVDLDRLLKVALRANLDSASVRVMNTGKAGSLIGALYSFDERAGLASDVPLRDSGPMNASTGSYPIRLDDEYTTVVAITNVTDQPGSFSWQINHAGGYYVAGLVEVPPGATRKIDLRQIRDEQKLDVNKHALPLDFKVGQFRWVPFTPKVRFNGRAEMINVKDRVSSSYSCALCCSDNTNFGYLTPSSVTLLAGEGASFQAWIQPTGSNSGNPSCSPPGQPYPVGGYEWTSGNTSVARVDSPAHVIGVSEGTTAVSAKWDALMYFYHQIDQYCEEIQTTGGAGATVQVQCAYPVNFHQTIGRDGGGGRLLFEYEFDSSTGKLEDLTGCVVGEIVTYPGGNPFRYPSPPYAANGIANPTIIDVAAEFGFISDVHGIPGGFMKPYVTSDVNSTQIYRYKCSCRNNGNYVNLTGPITIGRHVLESDPPDVWAYYIEKSGIRALVEPLP